MESTSILNSLMEGQAEVATNYHHLWAAVVDRAIRDLAPKMANTSYYESAFDYIFRDTELIKKDLAHFGDADALLQIIQTQVSSGKIYERGRCYSTTYRKRKAA